MKLGRSGKGSSKYLEEVKPVQDPLQNLNQSYQGVHSGAGANSQKGRVE